MEHAYGTPVEHAYDAQVEHAYDAAVGHAYDAAVERAYDAPVEQKIDTCCQHAAEQASGQGRRGSRRRRLWRNDGCSVSQILLSW